jgi:hypothetical protein
MEPLEKRKRMVGGRSTVVCGVDWREIERERLGQRPLEPKKQRVGQISIDLDFRPRFEIQI